MKDKVKFELNVFFEESFDSIREILSGHGWKDRRDNDSILDLYGEILQTRNKIIGKYFELTKLKTEKSINEAIKEISSLIDQIDQNSGKITDKIL